MIQPCWKCGGTGKVYNLNLTNYETPCPFCGGSGSIANQPSDEGRFPDEAEREYNANYEAKCKKTGVNLLAEPSDAVQRARQWFWDEFLTGHMCIPEEAKTILSVLDNLRQMRTEPGWIKVSDRLPEKPEYDWVLVHITLSLDGFVGLPHVAELRRGKWFSTEYDLPIEQILQGTVTHWMPLPEPPKGETI